MCQETQLPLQVSDMLGGEVISYIFYDGYDVYDVYVINRFCSKSLLHPKFGTLKLV